MKPKYDDGSIRIYRGDSLKVLKTIGTVDHVITDPPYGAKVHAGSRKGKTGGGGGSDKRELGFDHLTARTRKRFAEWLGQNVRRWSLVFSDFEGCGAWVDDLTEGGLEHMRVGIWIKPNAAPQFTGDRPAAGAEAIVISHPKGSKKWNGGGKHGIWTHNTAPSCEGRHPTEKPESLMRDLIMDFTDPGDVILDPFCGSGSTLRAAKDLGRRAIGIDLDPVWVERSIDRMSQGVLFQDGFERQTAMSLGGEPCSSSD